MGKARTQAAPKTADELVLQALKLAAKNPKAKWTGASAAALFNTKEANHETAIAECTKPEAPLLKLVGKAGVLTPAGFEKVAGKLPAEEARTAYDQLRDELPDDQVGVVARAMAGCLPAGERVAFIQGVIRRTPLAATELTPLLEEAVATEKTEHEARVAAAAKRRAADEAALKAMERAKQLFEELRQNRLDALQREYEAAGGDPTDLPVHKPAVAPNPTQPDEQPEPRQEPKSSIDRDFRRDSADQFAASWRAAWDAKKTEALEYVESAMWNIRGLRLRDEAGARVAFDGRYHECPTPVFTGDAVKVVRPGWVLNEGEDRDYVAIKALVEKV